MRADAAPSHERTLAYVTHSGFGHQYDSLMRGLFLAAATNRTLLVPPLMGHKDNADISGTKGCTGAKQIWEYTVKTKLLHASNDALIRRCARGGDSFFQLFQLSGLPALDAGCGTVGRRTRVTIPCPERVEDTLTTYHKPPDGKGMGWCDEPRPCQELLDRVANGTHGPPILGARPQANRTRPGTHCLGPINNYFVRDLLNRCAGVHPLAEEYRRFGLPWRPSTLAALARLQPPLPPSGCTCVYVRLPDHNTPGVYRSPNSSAQLLLSTLSQSETVPGALRKALPAVAGDQPQPNAHGGAHVIEMVSNCAPLRACEQALRAAYGNHVRFLDHASARERAADVLSMTTGNAEMIYDLVRCARCSHPLHLARPADRASSFFEAISLLHARWHRGANSRHGQPSSSRERSLPGMRHEHLRAVGEHA